MGAYNFKPQFVPYILDWSKRHTIRGERANPDGMGSAMHLFIGMRHPGCRRLMRTKCVRTDFIRIEDDFRIRIGASVGFHEYPAPYGDGATRGGGFVTLEQDERNALAWRDGFRPEGSSLINPGDSFGLMMQFWEGRLPFEGNILHWDPALQYFMGRGGRLVKVEPASPLFVQQDRKAADV